MTLSTDDCDAVAVAVRYPFDEAVQPEPAAIAGHGSRRIGCRISTLELRDVIAELPMAKAGGRQRKETEQCPIS
jgi:hypothetical protein